MRQLKNQGELLMFRVESIQSHPNQGNELLPLETKNSLKLVVSNLDPLQEISLSQETESNKNVSSFCVMIILL